MIPVHLTDVVVNEKQETYMVLLQTESNFEGSTTVGIGPFSALNISAKLEEEGEEIHDSQDLVAELLEDTEAEIRKIRICRDERGRYRAKIVEDLEEERSQNVYEAKLSDALALATETNAQLQVPPELLQNTELDEDAGAENKRILEKISELYEELEKTVENQDFERAEEIKPKLNSEVRKLEQSMDLDEDVEEEIRAAYEPDSD
jgi:bifunctional DNase/RNase